MREEAVFQVNQNNIESTEKREKVDVEDHQLLILANIADKGVPGQVQAITKEIAIVQVVIITEDRIKEDHVQEKTQETKKVEESRTADKKKRKNLSQKAATCLHQAVCICLLLN